MLPIVSVLMTPPDNLGIFILTDQQVRLRVNKTEGPYSDKDI